MTKEYSPETDEKIQTLLDDLFSTVQNKFEKYKDYPAYKELMFGSSVGMLEGIILRLALETDQTEFITELLKDAIEVQKSIKIDKET